MKKNTILYVLLIFLIAVNAFFLFNYIGKDSDSNQKRVPRDKEFIVKELGFNEIQIAQFRQHSNGHHETIMRLNDDIRSLKDELFSKLSDDFISNEIIDSITSLIGDKEKQKDKETFLHFKMIQELSNKEQKEKLENIIMDALRQGDKGGNRPPPPNRREGDRPPPPPPPPRN